MCSRSVPRLLVLILGLLALGCPDSTASEQDAACASAGCADARAVPDATVVWDLGTGTDGTPPDVGVGTDSALRDDAMPGDASVSDHPLHFDHVRVGDGANPDHATLIDAAAPDAAGMTHRTSLAVCWTDPTCHRALVVAHGGDWNVSDAPFESRKAFERAFEAGADGIETDVHVTLDNVPVLAHSSPIEYYESLACGGQRIEDMTADEVTACALVPSSAGQTFQRLDDTLAWARDKLILELDVKESRDLARTISALIEEDATDHAFIMVSTGEIASEVPAATGWEQVRYMVNVGSATQIPAQAASATGRHVFLFEMDRSYAGEASEAQVTALIRDVMIPAGVKGFTSSDKNLATVNNHLDVFAQGFDVVLSYNPVNGVAAAQQENQSRGYVP
ncbi:MAG: glycerophosphodiester phosphodiesterase family protein [Pseudomonadota bacterium]